MFVTPTTIPAGTTRGFIVLDGVNGAGKSTAQESISSWLRSQHKSTVLTREPGATSLGKSIRSLVLEKRDEPISHMSELMLFGADRAEHVNKVILPALARSEWVICDRYFYSSIAFQGHGRGLPLDKINQVNALATGGVLPDIVLLFDLDPVVGLARAKGRGDIAKDSFEAEELAFHKRVREGFLKIAQERQEPFALIDASASPAEVLGQCISFLEVLLKRL